MCKPTSILKWQNCIFHRKYKTVKPESLLLQLKNKQSHLSTAQFQTPQLTVKINKNDTDSRHQILTTSFQVLKGLSEMIFWAFLIEQPDIRASSSREAS